MKKLLLIGVSLGALVIVATGGYFFIAKTSVRAETSDKDASFTFDATKAPGWWGADNNWPRLIAPSEAQKSTSAVVQRTIAQGTPEKPGTCFVMYFYYDVAVDMAAKLKELEAGVVSNEKTLSLSHTAVHPFTFHTDEGDTDLRLHQYTLSGAQANGLVGGIEFGVIPLKSGYIEIRGYCEDAAVLDKSLPVFTAVRLQR